MEELYRIIEQKIKDAGYPRSISGEMVYGDICNQIEGKENGSYVLLSKFEDDVIFEYHITVMDDEFNLGLLTMRRYVLCYLKSIPNSRHKTYLSFFILYFFCF